MAKAQTKVTFANLASGPSRLRRKKIKIEEWGRGTFYLLEISGTTHRDLIGKIEEIKGGDSDSSQNADKAGLGVFQAAAAHDGVWAFGSNKDQNAIAPDAIMASAVLDVPAAYVRIGRDVRDGMYRPTAATMGVLAQELLPTLTT